MGIKEWFKDTIEEIEGRFKNPLILSFVIVWLYKHWEIIYMIFNFEKNIPFPYKIMFIKIYIIENGFQNMVLWPLFISILSLIVFYLIGVIAQFIKLWLGKRLPAHLMGKYDTGNYELKSVSDNYKKRNKQYLTDIKDIQEQLNVKNEQADKDYEEIEKLTALNDTYSKSINEMSLENKNLKEEKVNNESTISNLIIEKNELEREKEIANKKIETLRSLGAYSNSIKIESDDLGSIFGRTTVWDFYLNDKKIESVRYEPNNKILYSTKGSIRITNIKISIGDRVIMFEKNTPSFNNLKTVLIQADENTLIGVEGVNNKVRYVKTDKLILN